MPFKDKAQLLISDHLIRCDSKDEKWLLLFDEKDSIEKSILKDKQHKMMDRIIDLYNATLWLMIDLRFAFLKFHAEEKTFCGVLISVMLAGKIDDALIELEDKLIDGKYGDEKKKITSAIDAVRANDCVRKMFSRFSPALSSDNPAPNPYVQTTFMHLVDEIRGYRKNEYIIQLAVEIAGIELLSEDTKTEIKECDSHIEGCISSYLENTANLYKLFWQDGLLDTENLSNKRFYTAIQNLREFIEMNDGAKKEAEEELTELLRMVASTK